MKQIFKNKLFYPAMALLLAALILGIMSYSTVNSSTYKYYKNQYYECQKGYSDCSQLYYSSSIYYKATYKSLMNTYEDLMDDWQGYIDELEAEATTYGILAGFCFVLSGGAFFLCLKTKKKNEQPELQADQSSYAPDVTEAAEETSIPVEAVATDVCTTPEETDTN